MFFIFGWNHPTRKDFGETYPITCPNCNNRVFLHFMHQRLWFTLFFIPCIPYESKYMLLCPICTQGLILPRHKVDQIKSLNQATQNYVAKNISESQYLEITRGQRLLEL